MKQLIIQELDNKQVVSARELYKGLQITDRFNRWFDSLLKYGFQENQDFTSVKTFTLVNNGAEREIDDYKISLDMAKQICMLQRSEKGKQYREYLLKVEKAWNSPECIMARALQVSQKQLLDYQEKISDMSKLIESQKPKVAAHDLLINTTDLVSMRVCAKEIKVPEKKFISYLLENGFLYRDGMGKLIPYAKPKVNGLFDVKTIFSPDGQHTYYQTMVTPEGLAYFAKHTQSMTQGV